MKYIIKSRDFHGREEVFGTRHFGRSGRAIWSAWRTISTHTTEQEARDAMRSLPALGAGERAIFNGGKRITK